jgi:hypothetical protein
MRRGIVVREAAESPGRVRTITHAADSAEAAEAILKEMAVAL